MANGLDQACPWMLKRGRKFKGCYKTRREAEHAAMNDWRPYFSRPPGVPMGRLGAARTFLQARREVLQYLTTEGWQVKPGLKIPHATSPYDDLRLWFKSQAVYFTCGRPHTFSNARTLAYDLDIRKVDIPKFVAWVKQRC